MTEATPLCHKSKSGVEFKFDSVDHRIVRRTLSNRHFTYYANTKDFGLK